MIKRIFLTLAMLAIAFFSFVALQPPQYRVQREATISASPTVIFDHINDLKKFNEWSPWAKLDPGAKTTFAGPSAGKDAVLAWSGNDKVGEGKMTVIESKPSDLVRYRLDFVRPYPGTSEAAIALKGTGDKTQVTWTMTGEQTFVERAMCVLIMASMDRMIGGDFERGLANLKAQVRG